MMLALALLCTALVSPQTGGGELVISEFMAANDSVLLDEDAESSDWIEIHNAGSAPADISGWYLTDDIALLTQWSFPTPTILAPGDFLIVFASSKNRQVAGSELHTNFKLKSGGEYLAIVEADGITLADEYAPEYPAQFADISYGLAFAGGVPTAEFTYFLDATPGFANGGGGPLVIDMNYWPIEPTVNDTILITAKLAAAPAAAITQVDLSWRAMYAVETVLSMRDDGIAPDVVASDGVWSVELPAGLAQPGEMLRWFVVAEDAQSATIRAPLFSDPTNSPQYFGCMIADPLVVSDIPVLHWFIEDPNVLWQGGGYASVWYLGRFYDNVSNRRRGTGAMWWTKPSLKFDFHSGHHLYWSATDDEAEEININSTWSDKSYVRRILAQETYANSGVDNGACFPIRVEQNGEFYSLAHFDQHMDKRWLRRNDLDESGALYKMYNTCDSSTVGVEKKTREWEDHSDLQGLVDGVALTGAALTGYLFDHLDLPAVVNYLAATNVMHDNDHVAKNYFLYRDTEGDQEWRMLPWDKDLTFGRNFTLLGDVLNDTIWADDDPFSHPLFGSENYPKADLFWNRFIDACFRDARVQAMYLTRLRSIMEEQLQSPTASTGDMKYESRLTELETSLADEAAMDEAVWGIPRYGDRTMNFHLGLDQIDLDFLPRRRNHLFETHGAVGGLIPQAQPEIVLLSFGEVVTDPISGNSDEEYYEIINGNTFAVDLTGWSLEGGVAFDFAPGTVLLAGESLYVSPKPLAFRSRATGPSGGQGLFVVGESIGKLTATEPLHLIDANGFLSATTDGPALVIRGFQGGVTSEIVVAGASPHGPVVIAYSLVGAGPTPTRYGIVDLSMPIYQLPMVNADDYGAVLLPVSVPMSAVGLDVWFQAYDAFAGEFTNGVHEVVQP